MTEERSLEDRVADLERQLTQLRERMVTRGAVAHLEHRIDAVESKAEHLERLSGKTVMVVEGLQRGEAGLRQAINHIVILLDKLTSRLTGRRTETTDNGGA